MVLTVEELRSYVETELTDSQLTLLLDSIEDLVVRVTHNDFADRRHAYVSHITDGVFAGDYTDYIDEGDTVRFYGADVNDKALWVVKTVTEDGITFTDTPKDETEVTVRKVIYPDALKAGVVNLVKYELAYRDSAGLKSETISRHSVTYADPDADGNVGGYPKALTSFLLPYCRARF